LKVSPCPRVKGHTKKQNSSLPGSPALWTGSFTFAAATALPDRSAIQGPSLLRSVHPLAITRHLLRNRPRSMLRIFARAREDCQDPAGDPRVQQDRVTEGTKQGNEAGRFGRPSRFQRRRCFGCPAGPGSPSAGSSLPAAWISRMQLVLPGQEKFPRLEHPGHQFSIRPDGSRNDFRDLLKSPCRHCLYREIASSWPQEPG
jgi:hypothetical protein